MGWYIGYGKLPVIEMGAGREPFMGEVWKRIYQNSGGIVVLVMVLSSIAGMTTFIWTEINSVKTEISVARTEIQGLRASNELIREDISLLRQDMRLLRDEIQDLETRLLTAMERTQQQITRALISHTHREDGSAIFKAPVDTGQ